MSSISSVHQSDVKNFQPQFSVQQVSLSPISSIHQSDIRNFQPRFHPMIGSYPSRTMELPQARPVAAMPSILSQLVCPSEPESLPSASPADIPASQNASFTIDNDVPPSQPAQSHSPPDRPKPSLLPPHDSPSQISATRRFHSSMLVQDEEEEEAAPPPPSDPNAKRASAPVPTPLQVVPVDPDLYRSVIFPILRIQLNQLEDHPTLKPLNLQFNRLYQVTYCITCTKWVWSNAISGHVKSCWSSSVNKPKNMEKLIKAAVQHVQGLGGKIRHEDLQLQHPDDNFPLLITPFEGVETEDLIPCGHCPRAARIEKALKEHYQTQHKDITFHRVSPPTADGPSDYEIAMYGYKESKALFDPVVVTHEGLRHNNHFLQFSGLAVWAAAQRLTVKELLAFRLMTGIPQAHREPWSQLAYHISGYFQDIVALWEVKNLYIRKHLRSDKPDAIALYPLDDFEETDTFRKYVNKWVKLFVFLRNQWQAQDGDRLKFVVFTEQEAQSIDTLITLFTPGATFPLSSENPDGPTSTVPDPVPPPTPAPQGNTSKQQPHPTLTTYERAVAQAIHKLSVHLIQRFYAIRNSEDGALVMFVAALAVESTGTWGDGRSVSPKLSGLIWCFRTVSFKLIYDDIKDDPNLDPDLILKRHTQYIHMDKPSPFEWIRLLSKRITSSIGYLPKVPNMWVDNRGNLLINEHSISFDQLCKLAQTARLNFKHSLIEVLCYIGGDAPKVMELDWHPDEIRDGWTCTEPGYSFLYDPQNEALGWPKVGHLRDCLINSKAFHTKGDKELIWNIRKINHLNHLIRQAMVWSVLAIHVTSGGTSRGTEITSHRRRNGTWGCNFYWYHGSHAGRDKFLPRTVDPELSVWLVILHRLFPELQHYIQVQVLQTDRQVAHRLYEGAYFDGCRQLDRTDVNFVLGQISKPIIGTALNISAFRHIIVKVHKDVLLTTVDSKLLQEVIDAHSAHTSATADANYAITPEDQVSSRELIRKFTLVSLANQKLLGLPTDGEASIVYENQMVPAHHPVKEIQGVMETLQQAINQTSRELEAARLGREVRVSLPEDLVQALQASGNMTFFKSPNQARLAQLSRDRQTNVGGFISTNAGKTLVVTLPSHPLLNPFHRTTIIAVPYLALQLDIWRRRTLLPDIEMVMWDPENQLDPINSPHIVIMTFDALFTAQLQQWCRQLGSHLARLPRERIGWRQLDCPITLLAGIMTTLVLDELKLLLGIHTPLAVIEEPPHRPEIWYSSMSLPDTIFRGQKVDRSGAHLRDQLKASRGACRVSRVWLLSRWFVRRTPDGGLGEMETRGVAGAASRAHGDLPLELILRSKKELIYGIVGGKRCYREFLFQFLGFDAYRCPVHGSKMQLCDRCEKAQGTGSLCSPPKDVDQELHARPDAGLRALHPHTVSTDWPKRSFPAPAPPTAGFRSSIPLPSPRPPITPLTAPNSSTPLVTYPAHSTYHQPQVVHNHFYAVPPSLGAQAPASPISLPLGQRTLPRQHPSRHGGIPMQSPAPRLFSQHWENPGVPAPPIPRPTATPPDCNTSPNDILASEVLKDILPGTPPLDRGKGFPTQVIKCTVAGHPKVLRSHLPKPTGRKNDGSAPRIPGQSAQPSAAQTSVSNRARALPLATSRLHRQDLGTQAGKVTNRNFESAAVQRILNIDEPKKDKIRWGIWTASTTCMYCWIARGNRDSLHCWIAQGNHDSSQLCGWADGDSRVWKAHPKSKFFGGGKDTGCERITLKDCCTICRMPWICAKDKDGRQEHKAIDILLPVVALRYIFLQPALLSKLGLSPNMSYLEFRNWCSGKTSSQSATDYNLHGAFIAVFEILEQRVP
ncbi:hypothetical protein M407DRAFT_12066 [Tulasnella calospora MUT 4182]|uniref:Uncharacterized protein n=1 Tax=Tulasnella calospora MUT 4182 TaxID=1051891 RepID=A0A0C3Q489_9AGAM|nr:hypothetical protein M407DRAFT_12066 [Tulasnella calospora MUT 4182]